MMEKEMESTLVYWGYIGIMEKQGYLEGQENLVSRLITRITHIVALVIPINY